jgi:formate-dependent nitrite reductase membrane component NrfD
VSPRRGRGGRGGHGGEELMVPEAAPTSYYGRPILKEPTWEPLDIAGYLFLGGLAGASSLLGAGADLTGRPALARASRVASAGAISVSLAALVHDLGRPLRFLNMTRIFKVTSPMSVGSWLLVGYAPLALATAGSEVSGIAPRLGRASGLGAAALGTGVATYTAALFSDTATPAWHEAYRHLPFLFAGSATSAAGGLGLLAVPLDQAGPARRAGVAGAVLELGVTRHMTSHIGLAGEAYETGLAGRLMKTAEALTGAGAALSLVSRRSRVLSALAGAALLAGSATTRFGIFHAGVASARDPKYVVVPQRARLTAQGR